MEPDSVPAHTHRHIVQVLTAHIKALGGPRDPFLASGAHQLVQHYIRTELGRWSELTSQSFKSNGREHFNWQIEVVGTQPDLAPFLVGAHYDTVPGSPGADDNGSGIAVLLMLAELLSQCRPTRSIHFIAFDLEEYGLVGSTACAERWRSQNKPLHLMLSLEMLGYFTDEPNSQQYPLDLLSSIYPDTGNFIALIGNVKTVPTMRALKRTLKNASAPCQWLPVVNRGHQIPATRRSDHAPFWDQGYSAIMVTDTANLRNPHYHTASDRIETLNIEMMAKITQGLATYLQR
ncbi:MAG: M28 family peptidase [Phormidesmis sp.]